MTLLNEKLRKHFVKYKDKKIYRYMYISDL